jgi:hypothetical protein
VLKVNDQYGKSGVMTMHMVISGVDGLKVGYSGCYVIVGLGTRYFDGSEIYIYE